MIGPSAIRSSLAILPALTGFIQLVLEDRMPLAICPLFIFAALSALRKKEGGVKPIAVGCTLRLLVAKVAGDMVMEEMGRALGSKTTGV